MLLLTRLSHPGIGHHSLKFVSTVESHTRDEKTNLSARTVIEKICRPPSLTKPVKARNKRNIKLSPISWSRAWHLRPRLLQQRWLSLYNKGVFIEFVARFIWAANPGKDMTQLINLEHGYAISKCWDWAIPETRRKMEWAQRKKNPRPSDHSWATSLFLVIVVVVVVIDKVDLLSLAISWFSSSRRELIITSSPSVFFLMLLLTLLLLSLTLLLTPYHFGGFSSISFPSFSVEYF